VGSDYRLAMAQKVLDAARLDTWVKADLAEQLPALLVDPAALSPYELSLSRPQMRALVEILSGAGHHRRPARDSEAETIILWNNEEETAATYKFVAQDMARQWHSQAEPLPKFAVLTVNENQVGWVDAGERPFHFHSVSHWFETLPQRFRRERVGDVSLILQLEIGGDGGRAAHLVLENGRLSVGDGPHPEAEIAVTTTAETWLDLVNGRRAPFDLFFEGGLQISGDWNRLSRIAGALTMVPPRQYQTDKWKLDLNYLGLLRMKEGNV
jgi:putative sterol carrier protein